MKRFFLSILNFLLLFKAFAGLLGDSNSIFLIFWGFIICIILANIISSKICEYLERNFSRSLQTFLILLFAVFAAAIFF